jgi:hypothetical protein
MKMILTSNARLKGLYVSVDTEFLLFERDVCFFHANGIGLLSSSLVESFIFCRRDIATTINFRGDLGVSAFVSDGSGVPSVPVCLGSARCSLFICFLHNPDLHFGSAFLSPTSRDLLSLRLNQIVFSPVTAGAQSDQIPCYV